MNLKALMFAGLGLGVSVAATSWWVGNDMANIRAENQARLARCAELRAWETGAASGSLTTAAGPTVGAAPAAPAGTAAAAELAKCPPATPSVATQGEGGAASTTGGHSTDQLADPAAAAPLDGYTDPINAEAYVDPAAAGTYVDPSGDSGSVEPGAQYGSSSPQDHAPATSQDPYAGNAGAIPTM